MKRILALIGVLLLALPAVSASGGQQEVFKNGVFDPPKMAPDFELQGSNGLPLTLARQRGKVVILEFGFTNCQKICPVTLANLVEVYKKLGTAANDVQLVFVTVDPERDSPARLREYLGYFNPTFLGATGTTKELDAVRHAYGVAAAQEASEDKKVGYQVHHSSSLYLIDREGRLRLLAPFGKSVDEIVHDIRLLLMRAPPEQPPA